MTIISTTVGKESLRRNGVALIVTKSLKCKNDKMISIHFQGKLFNMTVIQVYAPTTNANVAEGGELQDLELIPKKRYPFHHRVWECKCRKTRDIWSNRQIWPLSTMTKANRVLPREQTGHSKPPLRATQEKTLYMDVTRWSIAKSD